MMTTVLVWAAACVAGPDFVEGECEGDAGPNPSAACSVTGMAGGQVVTISGSIDTKAEGPGDLEDMYLILITDPAEFSATTVGAGTAFDSQLWLFGADLKDPLMDGLGLLGNDDVSAIDDASMLGPMSDDGTGITLTTPGLYYLAISGGAGLGVPDPGRFPTTGGLPIFDLVSPTEISGPDGMGGGSTPVDGWSGIGETGPYVIVLEGVSFIPLPCPWDCGDMNGSVGTVDLLALLGQWNVVGASCDFDGGGVGTTDFLALLANWGSCP